MYVEKSQLYSGTPTVVQMLGDCICWVKQQYTVALDFISALNIPGRRWVTLLCIKFSVGHNFLKWFVATHTAQTGDANYVTDNPNIWKKCHWR